MTEIPAGSVCPQCGSAAAVHSVQELGDMARMRLAQLQQGYQRGPAYPGGSQQAGQPGWEATPRPIHEQGRGVGGFYGGTDTYDSSIGDDVAAMALGAAAKFIGRAISRGMQRAADKAVPVMAANQETMLRNQIAIAERHPDLRACLTDQVVFVAGVSRVLPMGNIMTITPEQADAMVASLRAAGPGS